jgi:hypothetical protein
MHIVITHDLYSEAFEWLFVWMRIVGALSGAAELAADVLLRFVCHCLVSAHEFNIRSKTTAAILLRSQPTHQRFLVVTINVAPFTKATTSYRTSSG